MQTSVEQVFSARKPPGIAEVVVRATGPAAAPVVWRALVTPARWPEWAPVRRAVVPGRQADAELAEGDEVTFYLLTSIGVRATVALLEPGERCDLLASPPGPWTIALAAGVQPRDGGSAVALRLRAHGPGAALLGRAVLLSAVPLLRRCLVRLVHLTDAQD
ncbi:MAG TPA: hypothetical protein VIK95_00820 [Egibacteraceae bacterium]